MASSETTMQTDSDNEEESRALLKRVTNNIFSSCSEIEMAF